MILPFLRDAPQINFTKAIDSVAISAKFISLPLRCGVVLTKKKFVDKVATLIECIGSKDTTILGSRKGQSSLILWYTIKTRGANSFAAEAETCIQNVQYLYKQLKLRHYPCMLNEFSNTVVFANPSRQSIEKWQLAVLGDWAHIIVMQNITKQKLDSFLDELDFSLSLQAG